MADHSTRDTIKASRAFYIEAVIFGIVFYGYLFVVLYIL